MSDESKSCPKCQGVMTRGFLFMNIITPWFEGEPKKAMLGGAKPPQEQGLPNAAYRCGKCGFLELYAGPEYGPK